MAIANPFEEPERLLGTGKDETVVVLDLQPFSISNHQFGAGWIDMAHPAREVGFAEQEIGFLARGLGSWSGPRLRLGAGTRSGSDPSILT